jgi:nucleoside-diphosphate-sugar epimerase
VFAQDDEGWVDETSPTEPVKSTAKILLEAEKLLEPLGDKACTLRFSGIYRGHKHRMVDNIRAGALSAHIEQDYFTNRIHVEDCARALVHLLALHSQGNEIDRLYIGSDDEPVKYSEVIQWISEQTGCALNETLEPVKKRVGSKRLSNARLKSTGFELLYPSFRQGFLQAVKG